MVVEVAMVAVAMVVAEVAMVVVAMVAMVEKAGW